MSHTGEIKRRILRFGANATVREPKGLRQEGVAELRTRLETYTHHP